MANGHLPRGGRPLVVLKSALRTALTTLAMAICAWATPASAQPGPVVGQCIDQRTGIGFAMLPNFWMYQMNFPANGGQAFRDPSGQTFIRIPAANPMVEAYFADWDGNLILINAFTGIQVIGVCQFAGGVMPQRPWQQVWQPPQMAPWGVRIGEEARNDLAIPQNLARPTVRYVDPMLTTPQRAQECYNKTGADEEAFGDCMVRAMTGQRERAVYDCARKSQDNVEGAFCVVGALGGQNERRAAQQLSQCYDKYGEQYQSYALCMATQNTGGEASKVLACVEQQSQQGDVTLMGTAVCYGGNSLGLNPEMQVAVQCAMATGGEPYSFAACAGGQLTAREIQKCLNNGIGGDDGCFGPNNEIVKALRTVGVNLEFGPNNDIRKTWNNAVNDLQHGPGPNNEAVKAVRTIANDITRGPGPNNDIVRAIDSVLPGFKRLF